MLDNHLGNKKKKKKALKEPFHSFITEGNYACAPHGICLILNGSDFREQHRLAKGQPIDFQMVQRSSDLEL